MFELDTRFLEMATESQLRQLCLVCVENSMEVKRCDMCDVQEKLQEFRRGE